MLHNALAEYLDRIEQAINQCQNVNIERYVEEILTPERANLRIRMRFANGHLLEVNEAAIVSQNQLTTLDYRYHCQNSQNQLVFRYDSTPHFPNLPTFPHHKHLPTDVIAHEKPDLEDVLQEVLALLRSD